MRALLAELAAMVDRVRLAAISSFVAGAIVLAALLAGNPGIRIGDGGWIILVGITVASAYQVSGSRRRAGRPDAGTWGLATGGGLLIAFAAFGAVSFLLQPVVTSTPVLADNPVPLAVLAWVLLGAGAVAWQRGSQHRAIAAALVLSMGTILAGVAVLRDGTSWGPAAIIAVVGGLIVFFAAGGAGFQQWSRASPSGPARAAAPAAPGTRPRKSNPQGARRARRNRGRQR